MSVRLAGGKLVGRLLAGPPRARAQRGNPAASDGTRPTAARLRKSLFTVLADELAGARVLDVCAGVGTLGFEAISRGAREVVFVERSPRMARLIGRNGERLGVEPFRVLAGEAGRELRRLDSAGEAFDVAFLDPPWEYWETEAGVRLLAGAAALAPLVVAEHRSSWSPPDVCPGAREDPDTQANPFPAVRTRTTAAGDGAFSLYLREMNPGEPSTIPQTRKGSISSCPAAEFARNVENSRPKAGTAPDERTPDDS